MYVCMYVVGIEPAFPVLHVRFANHCTITTTLLESKEEVIC